MNPDKRFIPEQQLTTLITGKETVVDPELEAEVELIERARKTQDIGEKLAKMIMENPTEEEILAFLNEESHWTTFSEYTNNPRLQEILSKEVGPGKLWSILVKDYDTKHDFILIPNEFKTTIDPIIQKTLDFCPLYFCPLDFFKQKAYEIEFNNIFFTIYNEINKSDDTESRNLINLFKSMTSSFDIAIEQNKLKITINTHTNINFKMPVKNNKTKKYTPHQIKQFLKDRKILEEISEKMRAKFNIPVQITIK